MMDRRAFLRRTSLALAGGLIVGDAALEMFERLNHSKVFALGGITRTIPVYLQTSWIGAGAMILDGGYEAVMSTSAPRMGQLTLPANDPLVMAYDRDGYVDLSSDEFDKM